MSTALGMGFAAALKGGMDEYNKYAYEEWLTQKRLETDQLRREAEFQFEKDTEAERLAMRQRAAQADADTEAAIFNNPNQVAMREQQNREAIENEKARLRELDPIRRRQALADEEAKLLFKMEFEEKYADRLAEIDNNRNLTDDAANQERVKAWTEYFKTELDMTDEEARDAATEYVLDVGPNTSRTTLKFDKALGTAFMGNVASDINGWFAGGISSIPKDAPSPATAKGETADGDGQRAASRAHGDLVAAISNGKLEDAKKALARLEGLPPYTKSFIEDGIKRARSFLDKFETEDQFKQFAAPNGWEALEQARSMWASVGGASQDSYDAMAAEEPDEQAGLASPVPDDAYGLTPEERRQRAIGAFSEGSGRAIGDLPY